MKKLLLISNPSVLGKNLENILKQNYHTDFISTVPKQIGSIPFNSYNALLLRNLKSLPHVHVSALFYQIQV